MIFQGLMIVAFFWELETPTGVGLYDQSRRRIGFTTWSKCQVLARGGAGVVD